MEPRDNDHFSRRLTLDRLAELESAGDVEALIDEPKTPVLHGIAVGWWAWCCARDTIMEDTVASATSYELTDRIAGDRIAVFKGRRADGVPVLMHQLTSGFDHSNVLKLGIAYMLHHPPANGGLIWDLVERDGLTYLVTADQPDCLELSGWLAREVGHALAPEAEVTAEVLPPAPSTAASIGGASLVGFTPFLGSIQSTSGTLSTPHATRPPAPKPVGAFTTPEPQAGPVSPAQSNAATTPAPAPSTTPPAAAPAATDPLASPAVPLPAFLGGAAPAVVTPPASEAPVYVITQPKPGLGKTIISTALGFLVVAAVFWIAMLVVRSLK